MSSLAELEYEVEAVLCRVRQLTDKKERAKLFNAEMDRLGVTDPALKRELWISNETAAA